MVRNEANKMDIHTDNIRLIEFTTSQGRIQAQKGQDRVICLASSVCIVPRQVAQDTNKPVIYKQHTVLAVHGQESSESGQELECGHHS